MTPDRGGRPENILALAEAGAETELTGDQESVWQEVVKRVDEVYSDLLRYEADLESKNAELEEAQSFISSVIASVSDILVVSDAKGFVIQANPAFVRLLGREEKSLLGQKLLELIVSDDHDRAENFLRGAGLAGDCELRFLTTRGPSRHDGDQFLAAPRPCRPLRRRCADRAADRGAAPRL